MEKKVVTVEFIMDLSTRVNNLIDNCKKYKKSIFEKIISNDGECATYYMEHEFSDLVINDRKLEIYQFLRGICEKSTVDDFQQRVQQLVNQLTEEIFKENLTNQSSNPMTNIRCRAEYEANKKCLLFIHQLVNDVMEINLTSNSRFL